MNALAPLSSLGLIQSGEFFAPVDTSLLAALLSTYKLTRANVDGVANFMASAECQTAMHYYLKACRDDQGRVGLGVDQLIRRDAAIAALNADYWDKALKLTDVLECMPQKRRDDWHELIRTMATPDFTEENVIPTLQDLLSSREKFFAERVDGIFRALSGEHVTNSPSGFGKRMILYVQGTYGLSHTTNCGHIDDLRKIIARFMGRDEPRTYGLTYEAVKAGMAQTGEWLTIDGGALRIRCYMKGTAHLEVHPDMAWRLNAVLASLYPLAIPPEFRSKPKRKPKDIILMQKPLSFAVVGALSGAKEAREKVTAGYRDDWKTIRNSRTLPYNLDKFVEADAERVYAAIGGVKAKIGAAYHYWQFDYDPTQVLGEIIASGCIPDHKSHQFYPTPECLARLAVEMAEIDPENHLCLEPSAGQGGLADLMPDPVCVEISGLHCEILKAKGHHVECADFLKWQITGKYDRVVMNPPFSDGRWQAHVEHASGMVRDGGRLVAILPASAKDKFTLPGFQCEWSEVYDNEFAGTGVSVVILKASK